MMKKFEVLQEDKNDCGAACLSSIIKYYGGYLPLEDIKDLIKVDRMGTNAYDISVGAKAIGFECISKKMTFEEIKNIRNGFPIIAHVKKGNYFHFVVIYEVSLSKGKVLIMDPAIGYRKLTLKEFETNYLGTVLLLDKVKELPKMNKKNEFLKVIISNLLKDKRKIILISFLSFVTFMFNMLEIIIYRFVFDNLTDYSLIKVLYILLIFVIHKNIITFISDRMFIKLKYNLELNINNETLNRLFNLPYNYYKNKTTGEIVSRINDLDALKDLFLEIVTSFIVNLILILTSLFIILYINVYMFLITLIVLLLYLLIVVSFKGLFKRKTRLIQESKGFFNNNLIETIEAIETINNLGIKTNRIKILRNNFIELSKINKVFNKEISTEHLFKNLVYDISSILLIFLSLKQVANGNFKIVDVMILYMFYSYFMSVIKSIIDKIPQITFAFSNLEKVNQILLNNKNKDSKDLINGFIKVTNLSYAIGGKTLFKDLNFTVKEGEKVFIKGKSGTGKSTLLKILLKYNTFYNGIIQIRGTDYKNINDNVINNSFTFIGQNEKLFADTLINNLVLERNIDRNKVEEVIKLCEIDEILKNKKLNEDFYIEEGGFNLSGGERQRIILARGLLKDSNFILIDEALSEVDLAREMRIIGNILKKYKDKTIMYVSHKLETCKLFDKVIDIERRN